MSFEFRKLAIPDVVLVHSAVHGDSRGFFEETYRADEFAAAGIGAEFVQDNHSFSQGGVVRGMHWQAPPFAQGKLVSVVQGRVFDVAVDVRAGSPTYGKWVGVVLDDRECDKLWIPPGFAHGMAVLSETVHFVFKCTAYYNRQSERGFRWDDPAVGIEWPLDALSAKILPRDLALPSFSEIEAVEL